MKKVILTEILFLEKKRQKALEKKLNCEFIRINTSKENYDVSYEASRIQTFISNFNKNKIKELEDEIKKLKLQLANPSVKNNDYNNNDNDNNNKKLIIMIITNNHNNKIKKYYLIFY